MCNPAEPTGPTIGAMTDVGNSQPLGEWVCAGHQVSHDCQGTMFSEGPSRVPVPVASVTFAATNSFSLARAARALSVPEGPGFESMQVKFVCVSRFNSIHILKQCYLWYA